MAQLLKNLPAMWKTWFDPWVGKMPWRRERLPHYSPWGCKESDTAERLLLFFHYIVSKLAFYHVLQIYIFNLLVTHLFTFLKIIFSMQIFKTDKHFLYHLNSQNL